MIRPTCILVNLRKLTCEITIYTNGPNSHAEILQLAHCLDSAPRLETLELHVSIFLFSFASLFFYNVFFFGKEQHLASVDW
jgi:hypothetical protein